ncbi:MAG: apolipoprotein N-acyltransferase [Armatimonadota bacterium]
MKTPRTQTAGPTEGAIFGSDRAGRPIWRLLIFVIISAAAAAAAFPPLEINALAWVALVPLYLAVSQCHPQQGFALGLVFGVLFMGYCSSFAGQFGFLPWAAISLLMGLFYALFGMIGGLLAPLNDPPLRVLGLAGAWTLCELARGYFGPFAYSFGQIGYSQHAMIPMLQVASMTGVYGLGMLMAATTAGIATLLQAFLPPGKWYYPPGDHRQFTRMAGRTMLAVYAAVFITYVWGAMVVGRADDEVTSGLKVAAVQGNISIKPGETSYELDETLDIYFSLTKELPEDVRLVVWPETAIPAYLNEQPELQRRVAGLAKTLDTYMLVGALDRTNDRIYNGAFLFSPDGELTDVYRKMDLVMFGEWVPYREELPFLKRYPIREWDFSPGSQRTVMFVDGLAISPIICFEAIFSRASREVTHLDAECIVVLNSDAWADRSAEIMHNSYTAPLRAAESRRPLVRAASTGVSGIYDSYGRPVETVPANSQGTAVARIEGRGHLSAYDKWGDAPVIVICMLGLIMALVNLPHRRLASAPPRADS